MVNPRMGFSRFVAHLLVLLTWASIADAAPILGAYADVSATWDNVSISSPPSPSGLAVASPPDAVAGDINSDADQSLARAFASVTPDADGKLLRSSSSVSGGSNLGTSMEATSTARVVTQWMVATDGTVVSPGSPVNLDTALSFDGSLSALNGVPFAEMIATMNVYRGGVMTTVFEGAGRMQSGTLGPSSNVLTTSGGFSGQFKHPCAISARTACLDFNEDFTQLFSVTVGELFEVELILRTHAQGVIGGEALANADFYNSGGFELSTGDVGGLRLSQVFDAPIAAVPEPATLALLGLGVAGLGFSRRKR